MRYLTISYTVTFPNPNAAPMHYPNSLLRTPDGEMFYSPEGGPSHFYRKEYEILKDHGELHLEKDWDTIEKLVLTHYRKYHRPAPGCITGAGWLSPDGKFYPCKYRAHDGLARTICRAELSVLGGTRHLETLSWIRVYEDGLVALSKPLNQAQKDTLWDLHQASDDEEYKERINYAIRRH